MYGSVGRWGSLMPSVPQLHSRSARLRWASATLRGNSPLRAALLLPSCRLLSVATVYLAFVGLANYLAFWLRFDGSIPVTVLELYRQTLPALLVVYGLLLVPFRLCRGLWRFTGIWDLRDIVASTALAALAFHLFIHQWLGIAVYPRSVVVLTAMLSVWLIGGTRLAWRLALETRPHARGRRILIYGAGNAGEMIARDLRKNGYDPIGFIDDDPRKRGQQIHRVPVLGSRRDLPRIVTHHNPDEVLVAMPSVGAQGVRQLVTALEPFKVPITTLPPLQEILDCKVSTHQVRKLTVEDLLPRAPVRLDLEPARRLIMGRHVLVTGAGGSIGSELSRQILALQPARLVLYERYENNLYGVLKDLADPVHTQPALGDVTDIRRLRAVLKQHRPEIIFHAAAHKHVPLMELCPCEAVKNNVTGTRLVAEAAVEFGARNFVLVSTDKAVRPSSLMGATKRVAELTVQAMAGENGTRFGTVRFGNVLGSNGSVIPLWLEQIAAGGPVTVTHPEMRRYFMLISEAVQLILQAVAQSRGGEIFVLNMGEQIPLLDMARNLIRLSGFVPGDEMPITFVGLRPGEKLSEELIGPDEACVERALSDGILLVQPQSSQDPGRLRSHVARLGMMASLGDAHAVVDLLREIVPTFQPSQEVQREAGIGLDMLVRAPFPPRFLTARTAARREPSVTSDGRRPGTANAPDRNRERDPKTLAEPVIPTGRRGSESSRRGS